MTYTPEDLDELIKLMDDYDGTDKYALSPEQIDLIIDALIFYKEMNTY